MYFSSKMKKTINLTILSKYINAHNLQNLQKHQEINKVIESQIQIKQLLIKILQSKLKIIYLLCMVLFIILLPLLFKLIMTPSWTCSDVHS